MKEFDQIIITISNNICKSISQITNEDRGFHSQNILKHLRDLVEAVDLWIYSEQYEIEYYDYEYIPKAVNMWHLEEI